MNNSNISIDEAFKIAYNNILDRIMVCHFPNKPSFSLLDLLQKQQAVSRALIYLKVELVITDYWMKNNDHWVYDTGEKLVWRYLLQNNKAFGSNVFELDKSTLLFLLYEDAVNFPLPPILKSTFMSHFSTLPGMKVKDILPWIPESEWVPGEMLSIFLQLNGDIRLTLPE